MGQFVVGDTVAVPFPFSDLSSNKLRSALVLAEAQFGDLILCQLTSNRHAGAQTIAIDDRDFSEGNLSIKSYTRPDKLFTAEQTIIRKKEDTQNRTDQYRTSSRTKPIFRHLN